MSTSNVASEFGHWDVAAGLPVFCETVHPDDPVCRWDPVVSPPTNRHWAAFGNRRFQVIADNEGTTGLWDTAHGFHWLTASEPGTGATVITPLNAADSAPWGTDRGRWPRSWADAAPVRTWGPTWFGVDGEHDGVRVERLVACPDGDAPWLLIRVRVTTDRAMAIELIEEWHIAPRWVPLLTSRVSRDEIDLAIAYEVTDDRDGATVDERRADSDSAPGDSVPPPLTGLRLHSYVPADRVETDGQSRPTIRIVRRLELAADQPVDCWFAIGLAGEQAPPDDPAATWSASLDALRRRLPRGAHHLVPSLERELPWHTAILTGGACTDAVLGGHTLDQSSAYAFHFGFNGAARDPLQHALPLVYTEPELALSVLRNTCSWAAPNGELPYALDGLKQPMTEWFEPSDQALWAMWLAAEYAAATGDLDAFGHPLGFHPRHQAPPAPLIEHLVRQFRHLIDVVGVGVNGHIRILNADWNDSALVLAPIERTEMQAKGESILNSAMAAWVLPRFAGLLRRIAASSPASLDGEFDRLTAVADEADERAEAWRQLVAGEWNGRWFRRAHGPGAVVGDEDLWLEVQPWAILCGAADESRAIELLATMDEVLRQGSPLGARLRGPVPILVPESRFPGEGTSGGVWFSINMTLAWAAASVGSPIAWDELNKMTLAAHTAAYPGIWEGTISGPDAYNTPESARAGATWAWPHGHVGMQSFPVANLHSHAQVVFTYLRLLGVEPTTDGDLRVGAAGGTFASPVFELGADGHEIGRAHV